MNLYIIQKHFLSIFVWFLITAGSGDTIYKNAKNIFGENPTEAQLPLAKICTGSFGKCDGLMTFDFGQVVPTSLVPNASVEVISASKCRTECINTPWCMVARFQRLNTVAKCHMYDRGSRERSTSTSDMVYVWKCCDKSRICSPTIRRCSGYWTIFENWTWDYANFEPLLELSEISGIDCLDACLRHIWCGGVNYHFDNATCTLQNRWDLNKFIARGSSTTLSYRWNCCSDYVDNFIDTRCHFQKNNLHLCHGYWQLEEGLSALPSNISYMVGQFNTQGFITCLEACEAKVHCVTPFYNQSIGHCVLITDAQHMLSLDDMLTNQTREATYQTWRWKCCFPKKLIEIKSTVNISKNCICIKNKSHVELYRYECDTNRDTIVQKELWDNMPFYLLPFRDSNEKKWKLVSNGYNQYWLHLLKEGSIYSCLDKECSLNSGELLITNEEPNIIPRANWFAKKRREAKYPNKPVSLVVIHNTYVPGTTCDFFDECIDMIWKIQAYHKEYVGFDIAYNFIIANDGIIYEGRGWNITGAHTYGQNAKSVGIAFIGWYEYEKPSFAALNAAKHLIQWGVENNFIDHNYILVGHRDVHPDSRSPGTQLHRIIQSWPRYVKEYEQSPIDCSLNKSSVQSIVYISFTCTIGGLIIYAFMKYKKHYCVHKRIFKNISMNTGYHIVPLFSSNPHGDQGVNMPTSEWSLASNRCRFMVGVDFGLKCSCSKLIKQLIIYNSHTNFSTLLEQLTKSYFLSYCGLETVAILATSDDTVQHTPVLSVIHTHSQVNIDMFCENIHSLTEHLECQCSNQNSSILWTEITPNKRWRQLDALVNAKTVSYSLNTNYSNLITQIKKDFESYLNK